MKFTLRCERIEPGKPNMNGRIYSAEVLQGMVDQIRKKLNYGIFFGRLGTSPNPKIRMRDASHRVFAARIEKDGHISADCETLNTEKGLLLEEMIEKQGLDAFEIIPCGIGSTTRIDGKTVIGDDYRLASLDIDPKLKKPKKLKLAPGEQVPEGLGLEDVVERSE